uniref:Uncharacterized protein n=1 Tax=Setaria viridis TaxID=4556 RepID=A0A4U6VGC7_SETVI|nr:hypothetical protein SEVIR_3G231200v2 [Setaria viridis]
MTSSGCEYKRRRWYVRHVGESNAGAPVPPALSVPLCRCGCIDGPDKYDPRIRLFPYHSTELKPYHQFRRWIPPPPNPPRMTEEEKQEAACRCVRDPPMCKCEVAAKLMRPNLGVPPKFTPFFDAR